MAKQTLIESRICDGIWTGLIEGVQARPSLELALADRVAVPVEVVRQGSAWSARAVLPVEAMSEGLQVLAIHDRDAGAAIGQIVLQVGEAHVDDMRAEVALLRAEMDMLKRAFRRHCLDSGQG